MKKYFDYNYLKIAFYTIFVVIVCILAYRISSSTDNIMPYILNKVTSWLVIFEPIVLGFIIAYLMNPAMVFFEKKFKAYFNLKSRKQLKRSRSISISLVYFLLFGTFILCIVFIIPEILGNLISIANNSEMYMDVLSMHLIDLEYYISTNFSVIPSDVITKTFDTLNISQIFDFGFESLNTILNTLVSGTISFTNILLDWVIAFMIAIYILGQKESFANGAKRLIYWLLKPPNAKKFIDLCIESHEMMIKFFVGKSIDSLIIGILCFIGLSVLKNPYALLISVIVGVLNMIPYFGPIIGAVPSVIITLFEGILPAVAVAIFILILQQFDGLYLGPKILGDSLGITPFWIIASVTIGGGLAGAPGMFLACPITAVLIIVINRCIDKDLDKKNIYLPKLEPDSFYELTPVEPEDVDEEM
ncbi:hypothetical protein AN639_12900 [Candidatus Epulonipiscium fishelsonii]|uniref:Uncharacterized protein n=1 Tax=Candidatus Epulonipiscium fishelsonii TaxID=77094 RepID=A0ACC8XDW0_9FIRM|nr:hypothetical protein AN396_04905 [Epulopiscium sp. SCG-B11WGA-EpuloA1]ONI42160.1 hypothetical protein AN639_12900 [Epulopiscium sp. SCG-B05WGA-EpuloA1]